MQPSPTSTTDATRFQQALAKLYLAAISAAEKAEAADPDPPPEKGQGKAPVRAWRQSTGAKAGCEDGRARV